MKDEKLYGIHPVLEALQEGQRHIVKIYMGLQKHNMELQRIRVLAEQRGIPVVAVARPRLHQLLGHEMHQGVIAIAEPYAYQPWSAVINRLTTGEGQQTVLALDGVTDVGNFAALIRTGVAFGVRTIIIPRHASVGLTPAVAKYSAGFLEKVALVRVANLVRALDDLKQHGFWVYGADMRGSDAVSALTWAQRVVLVLGSEGRGIRRLVRERCDSLIRIPMCDGIDSLNVAVAGAIILAYRWDSCVSLYGRR